VIEVFAVAFTRPTFLVRFPTGHRPLRPVLDLLRPGVVRLVFPIYSPYDHFSYMAYELYLRFWLRVICSQNQRNSSKSVSARHEFTQEHTSWILSFVYGSPGRIRSILAFVRNRFPFSNIQVRGTPDKAHLPPCLANRACKSARVRASRCLCRPRSRAKYRSQFLEIFLY